MDRDGNGATWSTRTRRSAVRLAHLVRTAWLVCGVALLLGVALEGLYRLQGSLRRAARAARAAPAEAPETASPWMPAFVAEQRRSHTLAWRPFVYFRRLPFAGTFITVDSSRRRVTPQLARLDAPAVYLFGGSTLFGTFQRDEATIPAVVARELAARPGGAARVTNFGETGHVFTQEVLELFTQLRAGHTPRVVVFYDGINDLAAAAQHGEPGLPLNEDHRARDFQFGRSVFNWETGLRAQLSAFTSLGVVAASRFEVFRRLQYVVAAAPASRLDTAALADSLLQTYARTIRLVEAWARPLGFTPIYVWQPALQTTRKPLTPAERGFRDAWDHDPQQRALQALHAATAARIEAIVRPLVGARFLNLTDVFDSVAAPIFADAIGHTYESANPLVARRLVPAIAQALGGAPAGPAP